MHEKPAVLSPDQLAAINAPIENARSLPAESYISTAFFEAERERVFSRHWVSVLFDFEVAEPGQVLPFELCGMPLLAIRGLDGQLRVFHNVVPYDGCLAVIEPASELREIVTPYHGWVYDLDGRLQAAPFWDGTLRRDQRPDGVPATDLVEVHCKIYLHTVFINLSKQPMPFVDYIAPIARQFSDYDFSDVAVALNRSGQPIAPRAVTHCNWKIFFDIDGPNVLHESFVHRAYSESSAYPRVTPEGDKNYREIVDGYLIGLGFNYSNFTETYGAVDPAEQHLGADGQLPNQAGFVDLYPAMSFSITPTYIEIGLNLPDGVGRTIDRRLYLLPSAAVTPENAAKHEKVYGFHGEVAPEDNRISEAVQKGAQSPVYNERFFCPFWDGMRHQFHRWVAADLTE